MALQLSDGLRNRLLGINTTKIVNGSFTTDATSWTAATATLSSVASGQAGNCLQIAESGGASAGSGYQDITTKIGHLYLLSLYFKKGTSTSGSFTVGTTGSPASIHSSGNLTDAAWAAKETIFRATATTTRITLISTDVTAATTSLFDEVVCNSLDRSMQDLFNGGFIDIYSGSQPSLANSAPTGTLLVTIYSNGTSAGLSFDDAASGVLSKKSTETWSGTAVATNTAGWFRLRTSSDAGGSSTTDERLDGACAISGAQLNMSSTTITSGAVESISTFQITMPAA